MVGQVHLPGSQLIREVRIRASAVVDGQRRGGVGD